MPAKISEKAVEEYNRNQNYFAFQPTPQMAVFLNLPFKIVGLFCGNQSFKTSGSMYQYVLRVRGHHGVPKKNVVYAECSERNKDNIAPHGYREIKLFGKKFQGSEHGTYTIPSGSRFPIPESGKCDVCGAPVVIHQRKARKIRICAEILPGDKESASKDSTISIETKNTVYPELKYWMPQDLIKRDITFRNPAMILHDPLAGFEINGTINKGDDIIVDFMGYKQTIQAGAGVQRMSIYVDEEPPKDFWDEQLVRLLHEDGDLIIGLTPAEAMTWTYDEIFERAKVYFRTKKVCEFLNKNEKDREYEQLEITDSDQPIAVIQSATDDNPTLSPQVIEELFTSVDDPDVMATRRFGVHRQISGRIYKSFDYRVHYVNFGEYFPDGIFEKYNHYRMIDYHPHNPWACCWLSLSPYNEAFVWHEFSPNPERMITRSIANEIALIEGSFRYRLNLIDPLAEQTQTNTGTTTTEDLNDAFLDLSREGICRRTFWESFDTKGTRGREVVRERLNNAIKCRRPFNNFVEDERGKRYLPTIWISKQCPETARSLKQWRLESWSRAYNNTEKDRKETPAQKWSHYCTAIEALFKDVRVKPPLLRKPRMPKQAPRYFNGRRAA